MQHPNRPYVLALAGFDPSGGAGLVADCKVFEQFRCVGLSSCTAITVQTEDCFLDVRWLGVAEINSQLEVLLARYPIQAIKIGIVEHLGTLTALLYTIRRSYPGVFVVWDPVMATSTGFKLMTSIDANALARCLQHVDLITPNTSEAVGLFGTAMTDKLKQFAVHTTIYLKGGHAAGSEQGVDYLIRRDEDVVRIPSFGTVRYAKHGSGCIVSAAIAAATALGHPLIEACKTAKQYTEQALNSNPTGLAYHHI